ncbi:UNVERIFIED_CONTAM: hypothetical protein Slati_1695800 [Sesamum latifolium]|uniref:Uncharacterized protein n=1 Tax=Sesamum latifolium TaxID=2727402 RepID=A0AAW2WXM8_9LAMI
MRSIIEGTSSSLSLLLNLIGHRSQYDTADLAVVLKPFIELFGRRPLRQGRGEWLLQDIALVLKI